MVKDKSQNSDSRKSRVKFPTLKSEFAARLKEIRGSMNQKEFASKVGIQYQYISRWEKAEVLPDAESLILLSMNTGKSIDWYLMGKEHEKADADEISALKSLFNHTPETLKLLGMTADILNSEFDETSDSLVKNIRTFHRTVKMEKLLQEKVECEDSTKRSGEAKAQGGGQAEPKIPEEKAI